MEKVEKKRIETRLHRFAAITETLGCSFSAWTTAFTWFMKTQKLIDNKQYRMGCSLCNEYDRNHSGKAGLEGTVKVFTP